VEPDGPAYNSELEVGDIIIALGETPVHSIDDLHKLLNDKSIGQASELIVLRRGSKEKVRVIPAEMK
jgi:S1-C subfamily serine protease